MPSNAQGAGGFLNDALPGVLHGLIFRDPGSATLTATYEGGEARVKSATTLKGVDVYIIQSSTKAFTASKDTYPYIDGTTGALSYFEQTTGGIKPRIGTGLDIALNSQILAKVVTDGTRVTAGGVTDLRQLSAGDFEVACIGQFSFVTAEQGAAYWTAPCNLEIKAIYGSVVGALGATDTGTVTTAIGVNDVYTAVTNGVVTFAISAAVGARAEARPSAVRRLFSGQTVRFTSLKTTTGGRVNMFMLFEKV